MTSPGHVRTAAARRARTRSKHERWAAELAVAGWWVVEAGPIQLGATYAEDPAVYAECVRCSAEIGDWDGTVPLPAVLAKVNGHVCEVAG